MSRVKTLLCSSILAAATLAPPALAADGDGSPGLEALKEFREGRHSAPAVQNRFFVKSERFELAPTLGYVPNNPFSKRYVGGVLFAYHFSEKLAASGSLTYSPDLGRADLKGLTGALVRIAYNGPGGATFQQPLDKVTLSANFTAQWTPLYGKINLVGETVLNFELYGVGGLGMISKADYFASYNPSAPPTFPDFVDLASNGNGVHVAPVLGVGANFFLNQTVAFRADARAGLYLDDKPQYDTSQPVTEQRLFNHFVVSGGMSFFFPRMKPRLYNF